MMITRRRDPIPDDAETRKATRPRDTADDATLVIETPGKWSRTAITAITVAIAIAGTLVGIGVREGSLDGRLGRIEARVSELEKVIEKVDAMNASVAVLVAENAAQRKNIDTFWSTHWRSLLERVDRFEAQSVERWNRVEVVLDRIDKRR